MKDTFSHNELKSIAPFMNWSENRFMIDINEVNKKVVYKIIFFALFLIALTLLMFLLQFDFFENLKGKNNWVIYIYIVILWGISQISLKNNCLKLINAKKYISFMKSES